MNCVIIYNGVSGSGKSKVVDCIKTFYECMPAYSKASEYIGINDISVTSSGENKISRPISVGIVRDISVMTEYARMLITLLEGPQEFIPNADYNLMSKYLRTADKRMVLVKLKEAVESAIPGCTNGYVLRFIDRIIDVDVKGKIFKGQTVMGKPLYFSDSVVPTGRPNKYNMVSCINLFFVSIREPEQIQNFIDNCPYPVRTLYITRPTSDKEVEDGLTDDVISNYDYDYYLTNPDGIDKIIEAVRPVMHDILKDFADHALINDEDVERLKTEDELQDAAFNFNPFTDDFTNPIAVSDDSDTVYEWKPKKSSAPKEDGFFKDATQYDENGNEITPV